MGQPVYLKPRLQPYAVASPAFVKQVQFLHPGYVDRENTLLILPALDATDCDRDGEGALNGVHHETARVACCILANCRWDGYFSLTRDGPAIDQGPDDILLSLQYYFRLDDQTHAGNDNAVNQEKTPPYPIVPSFQHFRFPPHLPPSWTRALIPPSAVDKVSVRDQTCRLTCSSSPNEIAHIVPAACERWWQANTMFLYTARPDQSMNTDCAENALLLRRDVHKLWDMHKFALVPKQGRWVVHVLDYGRTIELRDNYHNLELQPLLEVRPEFLLARFALAILSEMAIFARQPLARAVVMVDDGSRQAQIRSLSGKDCYTLFGKPSKNRSQSPKKRSRSAATQDEEESSELDCERRDGNAAHTAWDRAQLCETEMSDADESSCSEEEPRGRPRKRRRSSSPPQGLSISIPSLADRSVSTTESIPFDHSLTDHEYPDQGHSFKRNKKDSDIQTNDYKTIIP
ncbi:hypothetical protein CIB48_g12167 [Xylaria polymorpha]|nr:hypothetical protein CIB48_g12167 [Xylaria polymorpha]